MSTIRYLDPSAATDGIGTVGSPYKFLPAFYGSIAAGDTLRIKRGTTYIDRALNSHEAGFTNTNYRTVNVANFTIEAYANVDGSDDATLPRPILKLSALTTAAVYYFIGVTASAANFILRDVVFDDCELGCIASFNSGWAGPVTAERVAVTNMLWSDVTHSTTADFALTAGTSSVMTGPVTFTDVVVRNVGRGGIFARATPALFTRCQVVDVAMNVTTNLGDCISQQNVSSPGVCTTILHNCLLDHSKAGTKHCLIADSAASGNSGTVYIYDSEIIAANHLNFANGSAGAPGNIGVNVQGSLYVYRTKFRGGQKMIFNDDPVSLAASGGGEIADNLFIYELVQAAGAAPNSAICISGKGGAATPVSFTGNTVVNTHPDALTAGVGVAALDMNVAGGADTATLAKNNLFIGFANGIRKASTTAVEDVNRYWQVTQPVRRRDTDATVSMGSLSASGVDPQLLPNYVPRATSPLNKSGASLGSALDSVGVHRAALPAIGAFEPQSLYYGAPAYAGLLYGPGEDTESNIVNVSLTVTDAPDTVVATAANIGVLGSLVPGPNVDGNAGLLYAEVQTYGLTSNYVNFEILSVTAGYTLDIDIYSGFECTGPLGHCTITYRFSIDGVWQAGTGTADVNFPSFAVLALTDAPDTVVSTAATGGLLAGLDFTAAGMEFGTRSGSAISTIGRDNLVTLRVNVHSDGYVIDNTSFLFGYTETTGSNGKLTRKTDALLSNATVYQVVVVGTGDKAGAVLRMTAS